MSLDYGFDERMQIGKAVAMERRNRGLPVGKPAKGWAVKKPLPEDTEINRLYAEIHDLRGQLQEARLDAVRGEIEPIDDYGAEFDRLFTAAKGEAQACRPGPRSPSDLATPARTRGTATMTTNQYLAALKKLGLTPSGKDTARALGLSLRQCQRIAAGAPIPDTLAKLLRMYLDHGRPAD